LTIAVAYLTFFPAMQLNWTTVSHNIADRREKFKLTFTDFGSFKVVWGCVGQNIYDISATRAVLSILQHRLHFFLCSFKARNET
jgi:hypothetical protein